MKARLFVTLLTVVGALLPTIARAELHTRVSSVLRGDAFQQRELATVEEPELANDLFALAIEQNIKAWETAFYSSNDNVLIVPLEGERLGRGDSLTLLFDRKSKRSFFLLLSANQNQMGAGSVRLWSAGPTEIVIDARGIYYSPVPSSGTFRLATGEGAADNILCLARLLGFTINPANLETSIASIVCSAFNTSDIVRNIAELVLIGGHCLSAVNCLGLCPASSGLCIAGLAKWISCGIAECGGNSGTLTAPALSSPANGATVSGTAVTLTWDRVTGATKYQTQLGLDSSFSNPINGTEQSSTSARWTGFPNDGRRWYWRARAGNGQGWSQWSSSRYFINGTGSIPAPGLVSPANGAKVSGSSVTLVVSQTPGATKYQTQLSRDPSFSNPITGGEYSSTSLRWTNFSNNGARWYWRARAGNSQGWSQWSSSRYFINGP